MRSSVADSKREWPGRNSPRDNNLWSFSIDSSFVASLIPRTARRIFFVSVLIADILGEEVDLSRSAARFRF